MSIRDFLFYGLVGVYEYTSCVCVCEWGKFESCESKVWLWFEEGIFFSPSLRWEVYRFEFDRLLDIVEILHVFLRLIGTIIRIIKDSKA